MDAVRYAGEFGVGTLVGFLGGLFGKGGSAIATPLLALLGVPAFVAVAAPLPATIPGTLIAALPYRKAGYLDRTIVGWSIAVGVPATVLGSLLTAHIGATPLLAATGFLVLGFGLRFLFAPRESTPVPAAAGGPVVRWRIMLVALGAGLVSGLLANAGGFLLVPAYARLLRQPLKTAFACSLAVSMALALPATVVHAYLGHIDWHVTGALALGSVPLSYVGARTALRMNAAKLERIYGLALTALGLAFVLHLAA
jgi:uncharacterized membrane protein YfcA